MLRIRLTILLSLLLIIFGFFVTAQVEAATLSIHPAVSSISVGNIVSVKILINTEGKYINNAEGVLSYPVDLLEPISVSKSSSIFSLWVEEPKFNGVGNVSFNGGLPTPGYTGSLGEIITIVYKAKKPGTASLIFSDSAIRENDGLGTNILSGYGNGSIIITEAPRLPAETSLAGDIFGVRVETVNYRNVAYFSPPNFLKKVESYLIQVDSSTPYTIKSSEIYDGKYTLPVQNKGDHLLTVYAYDKAGNSNKAEFKFSSPTIEPPTIKVEPETVLRGDSVLIKGNTRYPSNKVDIVIQGENSDKKTYQVITQKDGSFSFKSKELNTSGFVYISAQLVFSEQVKSAFSDPVMITVEDSMVVKTSKSFIYTLAFVIPVLLLLIILILLVYLGWHKFYGLRNSLRNEADEMIGDVHKMMDSFKNELVDQLGKLEKLSEDRELNKKEEKIFGDLEKSIDKIDEFINKKIKKIIK